MRYYNSNAKPLSYAAPSVILSILGVACTSLSIIVYSLTKLLRVFLDYFAQSVEGLISVINKILSFSIVMSVLAVVMFATAIVVALLQKNKQKILRLVKRRLFLARYGNPLHFKDGEVLPMIVCDEIGEGRYSLTIMATSRSIDEILNVFSIISSCINTRKLKQFAVTQKIADIAFNTVTFIIEDVTIHRELQVNDVEEFKPLNPFQFVVQKETYIDLRTSGSMLVAGKTRSGKSTAIISILLQALLCGRDEYESEIIIIDPKQAELSRCSHVYTLDEDGEARSILSAMKHFAETVVTRQRILNELSVKSGDAVKWWEANMHPSFLFIDEYVAARTIFPKKQSKDNEDYCLASFDALIKRIVTMGASAGCFVIISIAEASVEEGGMPSMIKNAMSTKILLKPTLPEGRLIWDSDKLKSFAERTYNAGEAWFSSTDGIHDNVNYVHFPVMKFPVYKTLGRLLEEYYM